MANWFQVSSSSRGVLACNNCVSNIWMCTVSVKPSLSTVSCTWRREWWKHGDHGEQRRTYIGQGVLNDDLSIIRASWAGRRRKRDMAERSFEIVSTKQESSALHLLSVAPSNVLSSGLNCTNLWKLPAFVNLEVSSLQVISHLSLFK